MKKLLFFMLVAAGMAGAGILGIRMGFDKPRRPLPAIPPMKQAAVPPVINRPVVRLYFADRRNHFLTAEERTFLFSASPDGFGRTIMEALIEGPQDTAENHLVRTLPENTTLRALYITPDGSAYVDLSEEVEKNHPGGIESERLTVYSIVNSLALNIPNVKNVKILIAGRDATTLAGHLDIRNPLKPNMKLIR